MKATDRFDEVAYDQIVASICEPTLSRRDLELLELVATGLSYRQIAERCSISLYTVKERLLKLRHRLCARTTLDLLMIAYERGLVGDQVAEEAVEVVARLITEQGRQEEEYQALLRSLAKGHDSHRGGSNFLA